MKITKEDVVGILEHNYKSSFDLASMETFSSLMPICMCACESAAGVKDATFLATTMECIGIGWAIHVLRTKDSDKGRDGVHAFLALARKLRRRGCRNLVEAEDIIRTHLTDL